MIENKIAQRCEGKGSWTEEKRRQCPCSQKQMCCQIILPLSHSLNCHYQHHKHRCHFIGFTRVPFLLRRVPIMLFPWKTKSDDLLEAKALEALKLLTPNCLFVDSSTKDITMACDTAAIACRIWAQEEATKQGRLSQGSRKRGRWWAGAGEASNTDSLDPSTVTSSKGKPCTGTMRKLLEEAKLKIPSSRFSLVYYVYSLLLWPKIPVDILLCNIWK